MKNILKTLIFSVALLSNAQLSAQAQELIKGWFEISGTTSYYGTTNNGVSFYLEYQLEVKLVNGKYELVDGSNPKNVIQLTQKDADKPSYDKYNGYNLNDVRVNSATLAPDLSIFTISFGATSDFDPTDFVGTNISGSMDLTNLSNEPGTISTTYISKIDNKPYTQTTTINTISNTDWTTRNRGPIPITKKHYIAGSPFTIPEPSSTLSLLALGTLGAASTLKRQLKPTKSAEKETTKVG
ncbi:PEP-CTERM sorting domain-containing protein [Microcystis aeruginosa]|jgi:hypothetical protein|uniref:PEP-CTERM sorting domain-containing protein n=1 Tax=Microcystis aeruginosa TaxID=1126 RepID=UPI00232C6195|nr:PEP-CTERM sorting domain-containing protein [Microcystis aeruginosa]MDB9392058.1 PEP-CTERM sorting domain-containing protein [Microcystis aeruginosa CS-579]